MYTLVNDSTEFYLETSGEFPQICPRAILPTLCDSLRITQKNYIENHRILTFE